MTQTEFLDTLRKALNGKTDPGVVSENLSYYRSYISDELHKGRSEAEILEELGDPRLIARTILDAEKNDPRWRKTRRSPDYDNYDYTYSNISETEEDTSGEDYSGSFHQKNFRINKWVFFGIFFLILFIICSVLYFAFKTAFKLLFSFHGLWFWIIVLLVIFFLSRKR